MPTTHWTTKQVLDRILARVSAPSERALAGKAGSLLDGIASMLIRTTGNIELWVDASAGSDTNPGSSALPLASVTEALRRIPLVLGHAVHIKVKAGEYAGGLLVPYTLEADASFKLEGVEWVTPTIDGATSGTFSDITTVTGTLGTGGWTVGELRGKFVRAKDGTLIPIKHNTETTVVATHSMAAFPDDEFEIVEQGAKIVGSAADVACLQLVAAGRTHGQCLVEGFEFTGDAAEGIVIRGGALAAAKHCLVHAMDVGIDVALSGLELQNSYVLNCTVGIFPNTGARVKLHGSAVGRCTAGAIHFINAQGANVQCASTQIHDSAVAAVAAAGTITCAAKADIVHDETFTLTSAAGADLVFVYNVTGAGTTGDHAIDIQGATTAAEVATATAAVVNAQGAYAATADEAVVTITQATAGDAGNTEIVTDVAHASFVVDGFAGGVDALAAVTCGAHWANDACSVVMYSDCAYDNASTNDFSMDGGTTIESAAGVSGSTVVSATTNRVRIVA